VTKELESLVELSAENLSNLRKQADAGLVSVADMGQATENLTRARIELAKRREELSKQVGGGQLDQLTGEMSRMAIDRAEKEAQRDILNKQLAQVRQQLAQASTFDLEAARLRMAREALDILARRVAELQVRIANLQRPMVTTIGAN
jgi:chromosome segregation ATPase